MPASHKRKRKLAEPDEFESRFPTDPLQRGSVMYLTCFLDVLNEVPLEFEDAADNETGAALERLAACLADHQWPDAGALLDTFADRDFAPVLQLACAHAGMPGYAELVSRRYAGAAAELAVALRSNPPSGEAQARVVEEAQQRLRMAIVHSAAWSAVSGGHHRHRRRNGKTLEHDGAADVALTLDAALTAAMLGTFERRKRAELERVRDFYGACLRENLARARADVARAQKLPDSVRAEGFDAELAEAEGDGESVSGASTKGPGLVVVHAVGAPGTTGGLEVARAVGSLLGKVTPLAVASPETLARAGEALVAEFPHAADVIRRLLSDVVPGEPIRLRPTLLVGEPGGGKSRLAERLCEELGLPVSRLDAGAMSDKAVVGSPRRWHQSYPSLPLSAIERTGRGNPCLVVDELEKAGSSTAGSLHEPLLGLVDRRTAAAWHDQYIDAPVDLSAVNWLFTANGVSGIHPALLNRLRVLRVPRPGREHLAALAPRVLTELLEESGFDPRFEPPLDGEELTAIADAWRPGGGSLRDLQRLVEGVLHARHKSAARNCGRTTYEQDE